MQAFERAGRHSDKVSGHGYQRIYPRLLWSLRKDKLKVLEIGVQEGNSISLWSEYFAPSEVTQVCVDITDKSLPENIKFVKLDQSNEVSLKEFVVAHFDFDLIVDDGSHIPQHQLLTLKVLWAALLPGGIYILEDIETSYWGNSRLYGYRFNSNKYLQNTVNVVKDFVEFINEGMSRRIRRLPLGLESVASEVESVTFGYNSIILVKKNPEEFAKYYGREYNGADRYNRWSLLQIIYRTVTGRK